MTTHSERMHSFDDQLGYSTDRSNIVVPFMGESEVAQAMAAVQDCNGYAQVEDTQIVYDMDSVLTTANSAKDSFDNALRSQLPADVLGGGFASPFMHCFAVKACPVSYILHSMIQNGMGLECASIIEVRQSLRYDTSVFVILSLLTISCAVQVRLPSITGYLRQPLQDESGDQ